LFIINVDRFDLGQPEPFDDSESTTSSTIVARTVPSFSTR
jgi:hypothetical protein